MKKIINFIILMIATVTIYGQVTGYENVYKYYLQGSSPQVMNLYKINYVKDTTVVADSVWVCDTAKVLRYNIFVNWEKYDSHLVSSDTLLPGYAKYPSFASSSGKFLKSTGSGVMWQSISTSGGETLIDTIIFKPGYGGSDSTMYFINEDGLTIFNDDASSDDDLYFNPLDGLTVSDGGFKNTQIKRDRVRVGDTSNSSSILIKDGTVTIDRPTGYTPADNHEPTRGETKTIISDSLADIKLDITDLGTIKMSKSTYDADADNVVDDSEKLNNQAASYYLARANHTGTQAQSTVIGLEDTISNHRALLPPSPVGVTTGKILGVKVNEFNYYSKSELGIKDSAAVDVMIKAIVSDTADYLRTLGGSSPGGSNNQFQYKNGSAFAGASNLEYSDSTLLIKNTNVVNGDSLSVKISSNPILGNQSELWMHNKDWSSIVDERFSSVNKVMSGASPPSSWFALGAVGTAIGTLHSTSAISFTNILSRQHRVGYTATASSSAVAGYRLSGGLYYLSNNPSYGGFYYVSYFGFDGGLGVSPRRSFTGLWANGSNNADIDLQTMQNCVGLIFDTNNANWQFVHNDASGSVTSINVGFAKPSSNGADLIKFEMYNQPGSGTVFFKFTNIANGNTFTSSASTNVPAIETPMAPRAWQGAGGTSTAVHYSMVNCEVRSLKEK